MNSLQQLGRLTLSIISFSVATRTIAPGVLRFLIDHLDRACLKSSVVGSARTFASLERIDCTADRKSETAILNQEQNVREVQVESGMS